MRGAVTLRTIRAAGSGPLTHDAGRELLGGDIRWPMYAPQIAGIVGTDPAEIARHAVTLGFGEAPWTRQQGLDMWASICGKGCNPESANGNKTAPT